MIVELIPKKVEKPVFGQVFFLILSVAVLVGVGISFLVLTQLGNTTRTNLELLEKQLAEDTRPLELELSAKLSAYRQTVEDFKSAASERKNFLPFFELLERVTHPDVFFQNLSMAGTNTMVLEGQTKDFFALEQQRLVWKKEQGFVNVQLKNLLLTSGSAGAFSVEFTLSPELLVP